MRIDLTVLRYRLERKLALFPALRCFATACFIAGGGAAVVSGLLILDSPLKSIVDFILAIFFLGVGAGLWHME